MQLPGIIQSAISIIPDPDLPTATTVLGAQFSTTSTTLIDVPQFNIAASQSGKYYVSSNIGYSVEKEKIATFALAVNGQAISQTIVTRKAPKKNAPLGLSLAAIITLASSDVVSVQVAIEDKSITVSGGRLDMVKVGI